ncbi:MAG TPA: (2Fe-2S)-binding protein [Acetobacteraceae bacterium]|nr:(2Fe-2S)-binding protein [Acetobacteraceae bacterium]
MGPPLRTVDNAGYRVEISLVRAEIPGMSGSGPVNVDPRNRSLLVGVSRMQFTIQVNGAPRHVDIDGETPLLWVLRDTLDLKGTKFGCGAAQCGACTVHMDGDPIRSCQTPIASVGNAAITTIEAIGETKVGRNVQAAWVDLDVPQCGYCQAGQIMSATALLVRVPAPTDQDINDAMSGNVCRCATYTRIRAAIKQAAAAGRT